MKKIFAPLEMSRIGSFSSVVVDRTFFYRAFLTGFAFIMLIALAGCAAQNPPANIDAERQAGIEKELKNLKDKDADVLEYAIWALEQLGAREYANDIAELLKKDDATVVRGGAALALVRLGAKEYTNDIAGLLKDEVAMVRGNAVTTLGSLGAKEYADEIGELINDSDSSVIPLWDEAKKEMRATTVSAEAERVLKEWGVDIEKIKDTNR